MKQIALLTPLFAVSLLACSGPETQDADSYPDRPVELTVAFAAGGNTDVGARTLTPLVEEELGNADIQVVNQPGAGGWIAWSELVSSSADGYEIGYLNTPNLMTGYLNPDMDRDNDLDDFTLIANQVTDPQVISIRSDEERFDDMESLIEYARDNTVTASSTGVAGHQHTTTLHFNREEGTNFEAVHNDGSADGLQQFLGGHIDIHLDTVGGIIQSYQNDELIPIAVMDDERSEFLEDVPSIDEIDAVESLHVGSSRGIGGPADMPEDVVNRLADAFQTAIESDEHVEEMTEQGLAVDFKGPEEYREFLETDEQKYADILGELGWTN